MTSHIDHPDMIPDSALDERLPRAARLAALMSEVPPAMADEALRVMAEKEQAEQEAGRQLITNLTPPSEFQNRLYYRPHPSNPLSTLPIRRSEPKRPAGISARQWKKLKGKGSVADGSR